MFRKASNVSPLYLSGLRFKLIGIIGLNLSCFLISLKYFALSIIPKSSVFKVSLKDLSKRSFFQTLFLCSSVLVTKSNNVFGFLNVYLM